MNDDTSLQSSRISAYMLWGAIPVLSAIYQACIKLLALHMHNMPFGWMWLVYAAHSPWAIGIILSESISFALWLTILSNTSISKAAPITAIAYFMILLMSWTVFKEPFMPLQIIGSVLILVGVWLIGTASATSRQPLTNP